MELQMYVDMCLCCGKRRASIGNYCQECAQAKSQISANEARRLLQLGITLMPRWADRLTELLQVPTDRPEVQDAAKVVRNFEKRANRLALEKKNKNA